VGVSAEELRRVAELAALALHEDEVAGLTEQLNRILDHMRTLESAAAELGLDPDVEEGVAGSAPLRSDQPGADPLTAPPASMAPAWYADFFTVPQLASHGETETLPDPAAGNGA
jgi:aspartyl-tRNA(Asn)/glutamyl-tRNA(Gln) amidotransferase subunit C